MLTLQQISDRLEIQQLAVDYAHAIDSRSFDLLDRVFTADAYIDYRVFGGIDGRYPEIRKWLGEVLSSVTTYQHMVSNFDLAITGDEARGRILCLNPTSVPAEGGAGERIAFYGLWYVDTYVRTPAGWRISSRCEEKAFDPAFRGRPAAA